jgi:hypothetical protein
MAKGKGLIRSLSRRGTRADKAPVVAQKGPRVREPAACEKCGAVFVRQAWRTGRKVTSELLSRATWTVCPACRQTASGEGYGHIRVSGDFAAANETAIRRRISNVDARARFTQPERRVVAVARDGVVLDVLTTSQKLAHRIVRELKKAFRGRASYHWSDRDGSLLATWHRD